MKHEAPIFVKVKFNLNNPKDKGHIKYIANRPGVEKIKLSSDAAHIQYAGNRPKSTGLFGPDVANPPIMDQAIRDLEAKISPLSWRLVISLKEEDARKLGYLGRHSWEDLTRRNMEHFTKAIGLQYEQINWVAAHHPEQGHPHVHVLAYPSGGAPNRRGQLSNIELKAFRRGVAHEIFGQYRTELNIEKTLARNSMIEATKEAIADLKYMEKVAELEMQAADPIGEKLSPKFSKEDLNELSIKLGSLASKMPSKGRVALAFMPEDVKQEARAIADMMLKKPQIKETIEQYEKATRELTRVYTLSKDKSDEAWGKAYNDIRDRIANQILREAGTINKQQQKTGRSIHKDTGQTISRSAYRGIFKALDRERLKVEAQAELAKLQEVRNVARKENIKKKLEMGMTEEEAYKQDEM
ncbi:MAG: hypothetical protein APF76_04735 [Desulfitibacter sp. BRH_c19]|nr:MAG: hypothetical protein APF76_04735 [Desulfitibacter sp. BRH_c19]